MINEAVKNTQLSSSQQALLERRLQEAVSKIHESRKIPRRFDRRYAPLSFAQQRLWLFNQIEPGNKIYNLPTALHLQGKLNVNVLEKTINEIVRRHEVLRTRFVVIDGEPRQEVLEATPMTLAVVDFSGVAETEREAATREAAQALNNQPFDLNHGPFLRVKLLRLGDEEHVVLLTIHHIVSDGWSMGVLVKEVATLYEAYSQGAESPLPELPIQYADFAVWQRNWLQGEELERQLSYWREQLSGTLPVLELPADRMRSAAQTHSGADRSLHLSLETTAKLKALSRREAVTLFMTLVAAFQILLYRYTQQEKIIIGTPLAGRNHTSIENLIGFFINQLVLCFDLSGDLTFQQVLQQTKRVSLDALAHQDIPFDRLVEEFQRQRSLSYSPIFQVGFALHNLQSRTVQMAGLIPRSIDIEGDVARLDLIMHVTEREDRLRVAIAYSTELFDGVRIDRMLRHFERLVEAILVNPEQRVWDLPLLQEAELDQAVRGWNETRRNFGPTTTVHELFEAQAAARPDAVAVVCGPEQLSYAELNRRANQLAHYLRRQGIGPEVVVGLCMERSLEMVIGLLGIMKAGGAYLPLDPDYPRQRLEYMVSDAQVKLVLTRRRLLDRLPVHWELTIVLDDEWATIAQENTENPTRVSEAGNLVYVIYTSGSTGQPKGVMVTHGGLRNLASAQIESFGVRASSRVLQFASLNFDASISEICMTLCQGAQLHLASGEQVLVGPALSDLLQQQEISVATLPPTVLKQLTDGEEFRKLETLIVAGEACGEELVEQWSEGRHFFNAYGPTEATVCATVEECQRGGGRPAIGRAISNTEVYILDEWLNLAPVGVNGEIYIGGTGVARGYWQRADLTAERFVPHPYSTGERLYRTGDEGRYREDGRIEFLGRRDQQVKVRGFRIELGEIEVALESHGGVQQAVVTVLDEQQLVAYLVGAEGESWLSSERDAAGALRPFLRERLPEYMVPQRWIVLEQMPLTANGKIDRERLPELGVTGVLEHERESEWTPVEELVVGLWSEVLKREALGREDNFFELGGHSLLATQVISRVREVFGVELGLRRLFEAPTVRSFSRSIEAELRAGNAVTVPPLQRLGAEEREQLGGMLPLSFAQQRLWFLNRLDPESESYNLPVTVRLKGELQVAALERTLSEIVRRHEVLRTRFVIVEGEPRQEILEAAPISLPVTDLSSLIGEEREAAVREAATVEIRKPFDLSDGPMLRAKLLRLSDEEHVVLMTMHHIVSDGWSMGLMIKEVATLYEAYRVGAESPLTELRAQYSDFAVWQRGWLRGPELERQLAYWRQQLGSKLPVLELPTDRPRPAVQSLRGARVGLQLPSELSTGLRELSRREGVTLFMTLLAAFQTLLSRYSGQEDIVVGTDVANRNYRDTEGLIGFFVNQLVLRTDLSGEPTFVELLHRVKDVCLGAYAHQDMPFEKLVEELVSERDLSRTPLFQVKLVWQNAPGGQQQLQLSGLTLSGVAAESATAQFDMSLVLQEKGGDVQGALQYRTELFDEARIERMLQHFEMLLKGIVANPEQRLSELPLLREQELDQAINVWNDTRRDNGPITIVPELFEMQVASRPGAVAVVCGTEQLNYSELNQRANQLAHYLRKQGGGPDVVIGLCMERSLEMVIGLLGILKAGGAYLPLDPDYPQQRLEYMLSDAQVGLVLTQKRLLNQLPLHFGLTIVLDDEWKTIAQEHTENAQRANEAENLAYVIYTSGSTGRPKGVMLTHRGLHNLAAQAERFGIHAHSRVLQFASLNFDASIFEVVMALCNGGQLHLASSEQLVGPALSELLQKQEISAVLLPPTLLKQMKDGEEFRKLETLIAGGEACGEELVEQWSEGRSFYNAYGPTEATVAVTVEECHRGQGRPAIGRGLRNVEVYIMDKWLGVVPVGVSGEIYIGGAGLARGYWQRPELTAERFVPHPYSTVGGERLYRTGDEGRYLEDGRIEYLGRRDHQVKVRGYRIELGEIEAALESHGGVRQAVVTVGEEQQLVGYVVAAEGESWLGSERAAGAELRAFLQERLPDYMVPQRWVVLDHLPLTVNGKIDRERLPGPSAAGVLDHDAERAWTPVEELVAGIWSEVLKRDGVGRNENFFELGGHSLLATQVISRVREVFSVEVEVRRLFEAPTVRSFSRSIEASVRAEEKVTVPALCPWTVEEQEQWGGALPLSFAQQRLWFLDQLEPGNTSYNVPLAVKLKGQLQVATLARTFNEIVRRHEVLRTRFVIVEGEPRQEVLEATPIKLEVTDLTSLNKGEREAAVTQALSAENLEPFDLAHGPMLRVKLLRLDDQEHVVLLTMHHIVSDGWSIALLIKEVATLYEAYCQREESPLSELPVQYGDFAVWQRGWLQGAALEQQLSYWRKHLGGELPVLELPTDRPRPAEQTYRGAELSFRVTPELSAGLKELSRREGVTLFMTVLAVFQTLLHRYSGQPEITVGSPVAGRNYAETEGLIGFFVNTLALRTDLSGEPTFVELLRRVKEVCLGAYAHQDLPFEKLVEELQPERDLSRSPLFQTMLVLQNAPPPPDLRSARLQLSRIGIENASAKFDLTLLLHEQGEELHGSLQYATDLFERPRIERMLRHFETLVQGIVANPEPRLWELPLLQDDELQQAVKHWNETSRDYGPMTMIQELFEAQVRQRPEAVALSCGAQQLSYSELNRRVNQLAHYLRKQGVRAEVVVGLCMERSLEMVVGLLGILKAGGAYLPLDPEYPQQRLEYMLFDAQVKLVLTKGRLQEALPSHKGLTITLDDEWATIATESVENPPLASQAGNLVYVIYTSGSTGQPKGVMVTHGGLRNLAAAQVESFGINASSKVLQFASLNFDASIFEMCMALCNGGELHLATSEQLLGPALSELLRLQEISVATLPPTALRQLTDGEEFRHLSTLIVAGEACGEELVEQWSNGRGFHNAYGPTETTVWATVEECQRGQGRPAIGRAIGNVEVYILDQWLNVVPAGVRGEIYIGGVGVARGYWQRADLTAERFVPHPYSLVGGERLYRTGDEGRNHEDGRIDYLGRCDLQVKLRGYRIELSEIEAALQSHTGVKQAVVTVRDEQQLVGYVVGIPGESWLSSERQVAAELRAFLQERLPEYMVPQRWVVLDHLPLTTNGKLDRKNLPEPFRQDAASSDLEPLTAMENALAGIWSKVLQVNQVGRNDNFFELGGDSILSIQIVSQAHQLGIQLSARDVFRHQTVGELATVAGSVNPDPSERETLQGAVPLTPIQRWFFERERSNIDHFNQSVMLTTPPDLDVHALKASISKLINHHDALRMRFLLTEEKIDSYILPEETNEIFSQVDLSEFSPHLQTNEIEAIASEVQARLNIRDGPLLRIVHFNLGPQTPGRLLIVIHHLVVDGVSWRILVADLQTTYLQAVSGEELRLSSKSTSINEWAESLERYAQSGELATELDHWATLSKKHIPPLRVDFRDRENREIDRRLLSSALSREDTRALLQDVPKFHHTEINDVLIAALAQTLSTWTGNNTLLIDLEGHGREPFDPEIDLSGTVGWFTTLHPVFLQIQPGSSWETLLRYVGDQLRVTPNNGLGYGVLKYLGDEQTSVLLRDGTDAEVCFNYLGQVRQPSGDHAQFSFASESSGETSNEWGKRAYLIDINCIVAGDRFGVKWAYSRNIHLSETIEELAQRYLDALREIIACSQPPTAVATSFQ
jgi:amino acid adenylation domain-containing protein/non-ribosomal peptide synthase protein (TIGR01720 family)